jgi:hypothetical protein
MQAATRAEGIHEDYKERRFEESYDRGEASARVSGKVKLRGTVFA